MRATEICGEVFCRFLCSFSNATLHRPECHISASRMPHFSVANATLDHSRSVAFALLRCGIPDSEVRRLFFRTGEKQTISGSSFFSF